jgi:DNA-3-methyladenine glycosylase I
MTAAVVGEDGIARCPWGGANDVLRRYHDDEWGRPVAGEAALFERLSLEGAQAGLSWLTILNKREGYRRLFAGFDVDACAVLSDADLDAAMLDPGIVRNRAKVLSVRKNARATVALRADGGLVGFVEQFVPAETPRPKSTAEMPSTSAESIALSKALKKRDFGFVGPTTMFALMEAVGYVDTHLTGCFRRGVSGRWTS